MIYLIQLLLPVMCIKLIWYKFEFEANEIYLIMHVILRTDNFTLIKHFIQHQTCFTLL